MARLRTTANSHYTQISCVAADAVPAHPAPSVEQTIWGNYVELGENAHNLGLHELSDRMFKAALHEFQSMQAESADLSQNIWNLAKIYIGQQKYRKAERLLKEKLETSESLLGKYNYRICVDIERLATFYAIQGDYTKAERLYKRSVIIARRQFGRKDIRLIHKLRELASIYAVQGKGEKAESTLALSLSLETDTIEEFCQKSEVTPKAIALYAKETGQANLPQFSTTDHDNAGNGVEVYAI